jgi:UDP-N-acetyl-2-amino-2-deoxyglucuronate dehydrogenase
MRQKFAMIGVAGYVAPRHLKAIAEVGGELVAACDKSDSVGILDQFFPKTAFFTEFERFDRHLEKLKYAGQGIDYLVICSPNYLHDPHIRFGLRLGAHVICEKPLVLNPENAILLKQLSEQTQRNVWCILQLRLSPVIDQLREIISQHQASEPLKVELTYLTARGNWYYTSWKADEEKSGGILTNIGVHLFDLLILLFGAVLSSELHLRTHDRAAGVLRFEGAEVVWFLSIAEETLPEEVCLSGKTALRQIRLGDEVVELSEGFKDLHSKSYHHVMEKNGFGIDEALPALMLLWQLRQIDDYELLKPKNGPTHPMVSLPVLRHPFKK